MQHLVDGVRAAVKRQNLEPRYTRLMPTERIGMQAPHVFLGADDSYALRCAYLHQGDLDISLTTLLVLRTNIDPSCR